MVAAYTLKSIHENSFLVIAPDGEVIKNHFGNPFPPLSENISRNLCDDLNYIFQKNQDRPCGEFQDGQKMSSFVGEWYPDELRESFAYCVISTMMEAKGCTFDLDVSTLIQWDRVFRLSPHPITAHIELSVLKLPLQHLKSSRVNLALNYSQSLEEMHQEGVPFVPDDVVNEINDLFQAMPPVERLIVDLVYQYMDQFSITLPILWVAGKFNESKLVDAYWTLVHGVIPDDLSEIDYEPVRFLKNRLLFLKVIKWGYMWEDDSLPR